MTWGEEHLQIPTIGANIGDFGSRSGAFAAVSGITGSLGKSPANALVDVNDQTD